MDNPVFGDGAVVPTNEVNPAELVKDTTTRDFVADVVDASKEVVVLVDFWSERCVPCKELTPVLEKLTLEAAGDVHLVKMNVDEHPAVFSQISAQLGIQSIPAVIAFKDGRPVDGFIGALPESDIKKFLGNLVENQEDIDAVLQTADEAFEEGDIDTALEVYEAVYGEAEDNLNAIAGIAKCYVEKGDLDAAKATLEKVPPLKKDAAVIANVAANIELLEKSASSGELAPLEKKIADNPEDFQARFDLAVAYNAEGEKEKAADALLEIMKLKKGWNDNAAQEQLIQFFDAWGADDPHTLAGRQKLSLLLFS